MNEKVMEFRNDIILIVVATIAVILSFLGINPYGISLSWVAILLCGVPIIYNAILALYYEHDIKADILVSIAIVASIAIGEVFAAGEIAVIMQIGGLLEEYTVSTTTSHIEKLVDLQPTTACLIKDNKETVIDALELKVGDVIKILPGETIPADGIIIEGQTSVNQSILTGESLPVDKSVDEEVYAGTINQYGSIIIKVTVDGQDNSLQKIIKLIEDVNPDNANIIRQADKWANWIVIISFSVSILTLVFTQNVINAVTVLVVFCPCALVLATPTAIIAAIGNLSKYGILVKSAQSMEDLYRTNDIIFDKTGTLTNGTPEITEVITLNNTPTDELLTLTTSIENKSEHPLAVAVNEFYRKNKPDKDLYEVDDFAVEVGTGISGSINNKQILVGNKKLFEKYGIKTPDEAINITNEGATVIFTYYDDLFKGAFLIEDTLRSRMPNTISSIKDKGYTPILLTGDNESTANVIAGKLDINDVESNCLPEDKLNRITQLQDDDQQVMMIGDGINDASALKKADTGIAMGAIGSDITIDQADIVFINDDINILPYLLDMSKRTYNTINIGIAFSLTLNTIALILAVVGVLTPITGALVHNIGSVLVIIFAALLFRQTPKIDIKQEEIA